MYPIKIPFYFNFYCSFTYCYSVVTQSIYNIQWFFDISAFYLYGMMLIFLWTMLFFLPSIWFWRFIHVVRSSLSLLTVLYSFYEYVIHCSYVVFSSLQIIMQHSHIYSLMYKCEDFSGMYIFSSRIAVSQDRGLQLYRHCQSVDQSSSVVYTPCRSIQELLSVFFSQLLCHYLVHQVILFCKTHECEIVPHCFNLQDSGH